MKQFIVACCLLVMVASSPLPQDDLQPVSDPAKDFSSRNSPASYPGASPTFPSDSRTAGIHSDFDSPSGYDPKTDSDSGDDSRRKRSEEKDFASSVDEKEEDVDSTTIPIDDYTTTPYYEEESYTSDIFDWAG